MYLYIYVTGQWLINLLCIATSAVILFIIYIHNRMFRYGSC